jgi:hypothetical protein
MSLFPNDEETYKYITANTTILLFLAGLVQCLLEWLIAALVFLHAA